MRSRLTRMGFRIMDEMDTQWMLALRVARMLPDGALGVVGAASGLHVAAFRLAQTLHAPAISYVTALDGALFHGSPMESSVQGASRNSPNFRRPLGDMLDLVDWQFAAFDVAILGGMQVDVFGNVNTIAVGDHIRPKVRGPGAIGQGALSALVSEFHIVLEQHSPRVLVESVDYVSAFGHARNGQTRGDLGLPTRGPVALHTPMATFTFDLADGRALLAQVGAGYSVGDVEENTGFGFRHAEDLNVVPPPSRDEAAAISMLREEGLM